MEYDFISWWNNASWVWVASGIVGGIAALGLYFLPTIIAGNRKHNNTLAIFVLNLLLGFTIIGWIVALVWGCTNNRKK